MPWKRLEVGFTHNFWEVVGLVYGPKGRHTQSIQYETRCVCGKVKTLSRFEILGSKSCGCRQWVDRKVSSEGRAKLSEAHKGKPLSASHRAALSARMGTDEVREKLKKSHEGKNWSDLQRETILAAKDTDDYRRKASEATKRKWTEPEFRAKMMAAIPARVAKSVGKQRATMRSLWEDPEFARRMMAAFRIRPNKLEKSFEELSVRMGWGLRYVGDGTLSVGRKIPDFCDEWGNLVELFGDYWHRGEDPLEKIRYFAKRGYRCLVIWESELRNSLEEVIERVNDFLGFN